MLNSHYVQPGPVEITTGQPIFSAVAGTVVRAEEGRPKRNPVHLARDLTILLKNASSFNAQQMADLWSLMGNFIIIESCDGYAGYVHTQTGSIKVSACDKVIPGQHLANVSHSGNSTAPHLHFQRSRSSRKATESSPVEDEKSQVMVSLPEKLFILAIDDDPGAMAASVKNKLRYGLAGAILSEIAIMGKIGPGERAGNWI